MELFGFVFFLKKSPSEENALGSGKDWEGFLWGFLLNPEASGIFSSFCHYRPQSCIFSTLLKQVVNPKAATDVQTLQLMADRQTSCSGGR